MTDPQATDSRATDPRATGPRHRLAETGPGPVDANRPVVDGREPGPEERRAEIDGLRHELGDTVEELAHRVDVPARVKARGAETADRARVQVARAQAVLDEKAPPVGRVVRERPALVAGAVIGVPAALLLAGRLRRGRG